MNDRTPNTPSANRDTQGQMDGDLLRRGYRHLDGLLSASEEAGDLDAPLARRVLESVREDEGGGYIPTEAIRVGSCRASGASARGSGWWVMRGLWLIRGRLYVDSGVRLVPVEFAGPPHVPGTLHPTTPLGGTWTVEFLTRPLQGGPGAWELSG